MKTIDTLNALMTNFENWDMFDGFSKNDIENVRQGLLNLVGTAVMESQSKIKDVLPDFYSELKKS
jgi:hypothetical protein